MRWRLALLALILTGCASERPPEEQQARAAVAIGDPIATADLRLIALGFTRWTLYRDDAKFIYSKETSRSDPIIREQVTIILTQAHDTVTRIEIRDDLTGL